MQVETLRLSASTGRALERVTALQSRNQQLQASVAVLADDQRIERLAAAMKMVMPTPTQVRFLAAGGGSVSRAMGADHTPNGPAFLAALPPAAGTTPPGVASSSGGVVPAATSATNTGVASTGSSAATSPPASPAAVAPAATTPNGAAGVSAGG